MNYIITTILKYISRTTLMIMGWSPLNQNYISIMNNNHKMVFVFSHSSYFDFCIMVLYKLAYPQYLSNMKTLINAYYFNIMNKFLLYVGGIPANNNVNNISNILNQQDQFLFLISPKGSILKKDWKTGYYYVAKQCQCPIIAGGLDYEKKEVHLGKLINNQLDEPIVKNLLYKDLSQIVPLHPEQENMMIRKHNTKDVSVISKMRLTCILSIIFFYNLYK